MHPAPRHTATSANRIIEANRRSRTSGSNGGHGCSIQIPDGVAKIGIKCWSARAAMRSEFIVGDVVSYQTIATSHDDHRQDRETANEYASSCIDLRKDEVLIQQYRTPTDKHSYLRGLGGSRAAVRRVWDCQVAGPAW